VAERELRDLHGHRALAEATRFTDAWATFANSIKAWALAQDQLPSTHPIAADIPTPRRSARTSTASPTRRAPRAAQLVAWVGDEAFFDGLRDYFQRHAFGNASLADFLAALEKASGRDLADWSKEWLETAGVATLRPEVEVATTARYPRSPSSRRPRASTRPALATAGRRLYDLGDGRLVRRDGLSSTSSASAPRSTPSPAPRPDLLLVNDDDLTFAKLRLDERSTRRRSSPTCRALADPLARALCWGAAWDMTRDAELPTRRWVELVAAHAAARRTRRCSRRCSPAARAAADLVRRPGQPPDAARAQLAEARAPRSRRASRAATSSSPGRATSSTSATATSTPAGSRPARRRPSRSRA
jgi:aminopeptidase N